MTRNTPPLHARDLLTEDVGTVPDSATMGEARDLMRHLAVRHLPVLGDAGLVGLLHDAGPAAPEDAPVLEHVVRDVPVVALADDLGQVASRLRTSTCGAVVVLDVDRRLLGVITATDLGASLLPGR